MVVGHIPLRRLCLSFRVGAFLHTFMNEDQEKQKIREVIATWMRATAEGDLERVLSLMAEDVVFLLPGQAPMRKRIYPEDKLGRSALVLRRHGPSDSRRCSGKDSPDRKSTRLNSSHGYISYAVF